MNHYSLLADAATASPLPLAEQVAFWIIAPLALLGAVGMVVAKNAVHSALFLVITMFSLGICYILQAGPFIGMVQIIVYTGAIMILFLFVLMLVGRDASDSIVEILRGQRLIAIVCGLAFAGVVGLGAARVFATVSSVGLDRANANGNVPELARVLFSKYVFAFEVTSALLIVAAMGAMILAHTDHKHARKNQREQSIERFRSGQYPGPEPGPEVFATTDAATTPAIVATPSTQSLPGSVS